MHDLYILDEKVAFKNLLSILIYIYINIYTFSLQCSLIHCFIPAVRAGQFRNVLQEGRIFCVGGFEVGRCTNLYKITDNPFVIRFLPSTTIVEVNHVGATIEREKFMLRKGDHLQALANINLELPGII